MTSVEIPRSVAAALPTLSVFDITNDVSRAISDSEHEAGLAYVAATSPLAVVRVTERESGFFHDFEAMLSRLVPRDVTERERLIVALLGSRTEQIPFVDGRLCLGQWQRVLLFGFNGDASADFALTLLG
ncbi:MAG: YjbQ family protein [Gaiellales bacterium]